MNQGDDRNVSVTPSLPECHAIAVSKYLDKTKDFYNLDDI